ncbi:50S ribosomal protein L15 [bacterium HR19]|nr:50S ribosomal protein L15 [bacterium HR19]
MLFALRPPHGATHRKKRVGRGYGTHGKTSGRGHKGQGQRGTLPPPWFEGGQTPFIRRIPKRGFRSKFPEYYQVVNLEDLAKVEADEITPEVLYQNGLIKSLKEPVKILGDGEISRAIVVKAHAFSKSAKEKIEKAGGKAEIISKK